MQNGTGQLITYNDQIELGSPVRCFESYRVNAYNARHQTLLFSSSHVGKVSISYSLERFHFVLVYLLEEEATVRGFVKGCT